MRSGADRALRDALHHFVLLEEHAAADLDLQIVVDAVCMRLAAGIECLTRIGAEDRERLFGAAWSDMWGMRNRIAHGYLLVDASIVRQTVVDDIPLIVATIKAALAQT